MQRARGAERTGWEEARQLCSKKPGYPPGSTHSRVPRCDGSPPTHSQQAREHPGLERGCRSGFCLLRRPGVFPEAPQTLAREGRLQPGFPGKRSAAPFPRVPRGHREWQLRWSGRARGTGTHLEPAGLIAAEGCWSCGECWLIPSPILECYSVTYNRVTRAAADVLEASIGHRNKEGRVPDSGLYNPELCSSVIGSRSPDGRGIGVREGGLPREIRCCVSPRSLSDSPGTEVQFLWGGGAAAMAPRWNSEVERVFALEPCSSDPALQSGSGNAPHQYLSQSSIASFSPD